MAYHVGFLRPNADMPGAVSLFYDRMTLPRPVDGVAVLLTEIPRAMSLGKLSVGGEAPGSPFPYLPLARDTLKYQLVSQRTEAGRNS